MIFKILHVQGLITLSMDENDIHKIKDITLTSFGKFSISTDISLYFLSKSSKVNLTHSINKLKLSYIHYLLVLLLFFSAFDDSSSTLPN